MNKSLKSNGFKAFLATQFLGAFNDNAFKLVIAFIAMDQLAGSSKFLSLSNALFVLPFLLFATFAGFLADRFSKRKIIIATKWAEIVIMALGFFALLSGNIYFMFGVLFFMGSQSAFFSPSKYGILPEILKEEELSEGNGLLQMWTYAAIILGMAFGGFLIQATKSHTYQTSYIFLTVSAIGILTSFFITKTKPSGSQRTFQINAFRELVENLKIIQKDRAIFLSILGLVWFNFLGGLFHLNILLYARELMELGEMASSILLVVLAGGIGLGSFLAGKLSDQKIELGLVPLGAIGLSTFCIVLGFVFHSYALVMLTLMLLGISAGFYIVPLSSLVQQKSPVQQRGQILATNNFLTFSAILLSALMLYIFKDIFLMNAAQIFVLAGVMTMIGTAYITSLLPYALIRFIVWMLAHTVYKIKIIDRERIPKEGGGLLVCNHVSYVDALLLLVTTQRPIRFLVYREIYQLKLLNPIFRIGKAIPISYNDGPKQLLHSLKVATEAIQNGELVCIFPEGQLTRTGNMLKFNQGMERIMRDVEAPILPVHLDRIWGSIFSYERGKYIFKMPKTIPYPVTVSYGNPIPAHSSAFAVRNQVQQLGADSFQHRLSGKFTLPESFWREARNHPRRFCMTDASGQDLSYAKTFVSSVALSKIFKQVFVDEKNVGVLLPPSVGGVLANIALSIAGKVPVNINYTASKESLSSMIDQCQMKTVITSRMFLEKLKLDLPGRILFLEDIIANLTNHEKFIAALKAYALPKSLSHRLIFGRKSQRDINDLATIMFTSGSTGEPKGVMLTHANVTSNIEGLYQIFHVKKYDKLMGVLPFFHSFGFTGTLWFPLISGIGSVYHFNPLDAKTIGHLVQKHKATILMATPTFLNSYIKRCHEEQFDSLHTVVVGAEKLKETTANAFKNKFGLDVMEGYGCTELSPIVSLNLPDYRQEGVRQKAYKAGKIGLPLPGIALRVIKQDTGEEAGVNEDGLLFIKGPNVMKGYLNREDLTREVIKDRWYQTGDIANIDEDGFIMITDRLSRFSKIGGEMVPHIKIEETIHSVLNSSEQVCVVTSVPDEKKGEKLAVLHSIELDIEQLIEKIKETELPNLWIPQAKMFLKVEAIPLLGTGKLDLGSIKKIVMARFKNL